MRKLKGFTLTEALICILIIGVVSAFGGTIMKKSADKAYKMYYKSGYENLYNALAVIEGDDADHAITTQAGLQNRLDNILNLDAQHKTRNGIEYRVQWTDGSNNFVIDMTIPQRKTRANVNGRIAAGLLFNRENEGSLIPLNVNADGYIPNLQSRSDLLSYYIDDGLVGRRSGHHSFERIRPRSYKEAACMIYGNKPINLPSKYNNNTALTLNCAGVPNTKTLDSNKVFVVPYFH
ncbi:prepilin-type N-terminal cleavage/methylation domain-containing protein [bacterium]|nr:prepilin-type N-terminal cleavage/methylation domain-containing protein [bacterium]